MQMAIISLSIHPTVCLSLQYQYCLSVPPIPVLSVCPSNTSTVSNENTRLSHFFDVTHHSSFLPSASIVTKFQENPLSGVFNIHGWENLAI